jgi:hypothetical protein
MYSCEQTALVRAKWLPYTVHAMNSPLTDKPGNYLASVVLGRPAFSTMAVARVVCLIIFPLLNSPDNLRLECPLKRSQSPSFRLYDLFSLRCLFTVCVCCCYFMFSVFFNNHGCPIERPCTVCN